MALQTRLKKVSAIALTVDGGIHGEVTTESSCPFVLNQVIVLKATGLEPLTLRVRRVPSEFQVDVGPVNGNTKDRTDISAYTIALSAAIEANEQERPKVPEQEIERHTFQDEPTVARRSFLVDCKGDGFNKDNPLSIQPEESFELEVGKGKIEGHQVINIQSSSVGLSIADGQTQITNFAKSYTYKIADALLSVVSSSAADTNVTVQITGVDENFIEVVEILALNGTAPVNTVNNFIAVNRALVVASGGVSGNQGIITFTHTTDIIAQIDANIGSTEHGVFYVPVGKTLMITSLAVTLVKAGGSSGTKEMLVRLNVSGAGTSNSMGSSLPIGMRSDAGPFVLNLIYPQMIPEQSIVTFLATALVNNSAVNATAVGILIDDAGF